MHLAKRSVGGFSLTRQSANSLKRGVTNFCSSSPLAGHSNLLTAWAEILPVLCSCYHYIHIPHNGKGAFKLSKPHPHKNATFLAFTDQTQLHDSMEAAFKFILFTAVAVQLSLLSIINTYSAVLSKK